MQTKFDAFIRDNFKAVIEFLIGKKCTQKIIKCNEADKILTEKIRKKSNRKLKICPKTIMTDASLNSLMSNVIHLIHQNDC